MAALITIVHGKMFYARSLPIYRIRDQYGNKFLIDHAPNVQPSLYCLFTNWLASSKLVIFIFFASHNNFLRPSHLSSQPFPFGFFIKKLRSARFPIKILSVNGPAYSNGELVLALP